MAPPSPGQPLAAEGCIRLCRAGVVFACLWGMGLAQGWGEIWTNTSIGALALLSWRCCWMWLIWTHPWSEDLEEVGDFPPREPS